MPGGQNKNQLSQGRQSKGSERNENQPKKVGSQDSGK
jgi:hypothetical protein